jgi:hypothetical protein
MPMAWAAVVEVTQRLRSADVQVPVMLTAPAAEVAQRIVGLEAGADDYLAVHSGRVSCWRGSTRSCAARASARASPICGLRI